MRYRENFIYDRYGNPVIKTFHSSIRAEKRPYREHHHTECELSLFVSGSGLYVAHGTTYEFKSGDMFLFGSNEAHCITETFTPSELLNIQFEPRILWENPDNIELLKIFSARNKSFSNKFPQDDNILQNFILNIEKELSQKSSCYEIMAKNHLFSALVHMTRDYNFIKKDFSATSSSDTAKSLKKALNYINENLSSPITLKDISETACMSPTYFSAVFKKYNGISPWEYITIKRVEMAVEMLKTTDLSKLEIASVCGFSSSSNFYKAFAKVTGKQPKDFS